MKKLMSITWLGVGITTAMIPLFVLLKQTKAPPLESPVVANISVVSSVTAPVRDGKELPVTDGRETLDGKTELPPVREVLDPAASDGKELVAPDGKETLDGKKEILEPVGEMIGPASNAINPLPGLPAVELFNTPNVFNTSGPVVSPETK